MTDPDCLLLPGAAADAKWDFVVLLPLFDPPRHDTKQTIEQCIEKGIQVKMVTGDQLLIGKETAKQLGMGTNMYTTEVLLAVRPVSRGPLHSLGMSSWEFHSGAIIPSVRGSRGASCTCRRAASCMANARQCLGQQSCQGW